MSIKIKPSARNERIWRKALVAYQEDFTAQLYSGNFRRLRRTGFLLIIPFVIVWRFNPFIKPPSYNSFFYNLCIQVLVLGSLALILWGAASMMVVDDPIAVAEAVKPSRHSTPKQQLFILCCYLISNYYWHVKFKTFPAWEFYLKDAENDEVKREQLQGSRRSKAS